MFFTNKKLSVVEPNDALPGRASAIAVPEKHFVTGAAMQPPLDGLEVIVLGMGCFWGAERKFWELEGVVTTAVGYAGGTTPNPTYEEVCSGMTGHTEVVRVVFDPKHVTLGAVLKRFWESHNPTQGMQQGNDVGTQYRSAIFCTSSPERADAQRAIVDASVAAYQAELTAAAHGAITTEIGGAKQFYFAEAYHQQYLGKNPNGYCGLGGTGVACPVALPASGLATPG